MLRPPKDDGSERSQMVSPIDQIEARGNETGMNKIDGMQAKSVCKFSAVTPASCAAGSFLLSSAVPLINSPPVLRWCLSLTHNLGRLFNRPGFEGKPAVFPINRYLLPVAHFAA